MAKRKNAAALFEVIHADKRFASRRPTWSLPSPLAWLRRNSNGHADAAPALVPVMSADVEEPRSSGLSRFWNFLPPLPRILLDPDRHIVNFKISYTTALVTGFALIAAIALAFVVGKQLSRQTVPSLADQTSDQLREGPAQPDVLDVGPEGAPMAMATAPRPAGGSATTAPQPPARPQAERASATIPKATWNEPKPPTTYMDVNAKRTVNLQYVIVQSYPPQEKQMADEAAALLNKNGVLCTVETGLSYAPNWFVVVGIVGFDRVRNSPEYDAYVGKIQQISATFAGGSKFKKFEPRAFKWR